MAETREEQAKRLDNIVADMLLEYGPSTMRDRRIDALRAGAAALRAHSDESEASMICACGAPTNVGSGDGEFRCWKCHCAWLSLQESVGSCSTVPSSSPGSGCEGQQGTGGSGSSEVSWREAVEAGWDDGVRFASEVLRSQVFPRDSARAACVDRVVAAIRPPSPPEAQP